MKLTPIDTEKMYTHYMSTADEKPFVANLMAFKLLADKLNEIISYINSSHGEVEVLPTNEE